MVWRFERLCHISRKSSIFESARESGALFFYERERERRSEAKLRARAGAALGKIGGERERERRSKNQGARTTLKRFDKIRPAALAVFSVDF